MLGKKYGHLTVIEPYGKRINIPLLKCVCDCGKEHIVTKYNLLNGAVLSCGCPQFHSKFKHGHASNKPTRLYRIISSMNSRCYCKTHASYPNYGGRGIVICDEWRNNRAAFIEWALTHGYDDHLEIDRIDNNKGYSPDNCRFVTPLRNKRNTRTFRATEEARTDILRAEHHAEYYAEKYNMAPGTVKNIWFKHKVTFPGKTIRNKR